MLYAGSSEHADDQVKLGRMTDWQAVGEGRRLGVGQRLFLIDGEDRGMLEVRDVEFEAGAMQRFRVVGGNRCYAVTTDSRY